MRIMSDSIEGDDEDDEGEGEAGKVALNEEHFMMNMKRKKKEEGGILSRVIIKKLYLEPPSIYTEGVEEV